MIRALIFFALFMTGCAPSITDTDFYRKHPPETDPLDTSVELGIIQDGPLTIHLTAPDSLRMGSNILWVEAKLAGSPLSDGSFSVLPQWVSALRTIRSPLGSTSLVTTTTPGRFEGTPLFVSPYGEKGHWDMKITYTAGGESGEAILPVRIKPSIWIQFTNGYYVSWVQPVRPVTGRDLIEFALHYLKDENFIPLQEAEIDLYPWMNMGAGQGHSTPYEAPQYVGDGRYRGAVNFIMSGEWELSVFIRRAGATPDTVNFKRFTVY